MTRERGGNRTARPDAIGGSAVGPAERVRLPFNEANYGFKEEERGRKGSSPWARGTRHGSWRLGWGRRLCLTRMGACGIGADDDCGAGSTGAGGSRGGAEEVAASQIRMITTNKRIGRLPAGRA